MALFLLSIPLALLWMVVTANISLGSFLVGDVVGMAVLLMTHSERQHLSWQHLPQQAVAFVVYVALLGRDVMMSSLDVARRVLQPVIPLNPGIIAVATQDVHQNEVLAAFSAHGITLTPGELVLDFDGAHTMYVHCLDVEASSRSAPAAQEKRLHLLRQIMGSDRT